MSHHVRVYSAYSHLSPLTLYVCVENSDTSEVLAHLEQEDSPSGGAVGFALDGSIVLLRRDSQGIML